MATAGTPGTGEASAEAYAAYSAITQAISAGIADSLEKALSKLADPTELGEMVAENAGSTTESMPESGTAEMQTYYDHFWSLARGLECSFDWKNVSGIPTKSALHAFEVRPKAPSETSGTQGYSSGESGAEDEQEWGIGLNILGCGISFNT